MISPQKDDRNGRDVHAKLYLTVFCCMVVVVGAWAVLLPGQLRLATADADPSRWETFKEERSASFDEALQSMRDQLERLDEKAQAEAAEEQAVTSADDTPQATLPILREKSDTEKTIDLLRARLESVQQNE